MTESQNAPQGESYDPYQGQQSYQAQQPYQASYKDTRDTKGVRGIRPRRSSPIRPATSSRRWPISRCTPSPWLRRRPRLCIP